VFAMLILREPLCGSALQGRTGSNIFERTSKKFCIVDNKKTPVGEGKHPYLAWCLRSDKSELNEPCVKLTMRKVRGVMMIRAGNLQFGCSAREGGRFWGGEPRAPSFSISGEVKFSNPQNSIVYHVHCWQRKRPTRIPWKTQLDLSGYESHKAERA